MCFNVLRFVVVGWENLYIYDDYDSKSPRQCISLMGYNRVVRHAHKTQHWCFTVAPGVNSLSPITMACISKREMITWMHSLKQSLFAANKKEKPAQFSVEEIFRKLSIANEQEEQYDFIETEDSPYYDLEKPVFDTHVTSTEDRTIQHAEPLRTSRSKKGMGHRVVSDPVFKQTRSHEPSFSLSTRPSVNLRNTDHFQDQRYTTSEGHLQNRNLPSFRRSDPTPTPKNQNHRPVGDAATSINLHLDGDDETKEYDINSRGYVTPESLRQTSRSSSRSSSTSQQGQGQDQSDSYVPFRPPQDGDYVSETYASEIDHHDDDDDDDEHEYANITPLVKNSLMMDTDLSPGELRALLLQRSKGTYLLRPSIDDDVIVLSVNTGSDVTDVVIHEVSDQFTLDMDLYFLSIERLLVFYTKVGHHVPGTHVSLVAGVRAEDMEDDVYSNPLLVHRS